MLVVEMVFPGGRYHATPWDKHVNEGAVEWPPSPWRLLRAIIATWYSKGEGIELEVLRSIVNKLSAMPEFSLPPTSIASTCHYMPLYRSTVDEKTANVYDAFAHVGEGRLLIVWKDVTLDPKERETLSILLSRMGYLGRAESWVEATILKVDDPAINCTFSTETLPVIGESVPTMCCTSPAEYMLWRVEMLEKLIAQKLEEKKAKAMSAGKGFKGLTVKEKKEIEAIVPTTLFEALQLDTTELRETGWSRPVGSMRVNYHLPRDAFRICPVRRVEKADLPTVARYKVRARIPIMIFDAITLAERVHTSLVKLSDGSETFTGCDENGQPKKGDHTVILGHGIGPLVSGMRITDLTIYNKDGFTKEDEAALRSLSVLDKDTEVILIDIGDAGTFGAERGVLARSTRWVSLTPFIPTRCPKFTRGGSPKVDENGLQIGSAEHELRRLLAAEGYPEIEMISPIYRATVGGSSRSWLSFRRRRSSRERKPVNDAGFGFEIEFKEPIDGPLAMGYARNFGLGLFRPEP